MRESLIALFDTKGKKRASVNDVRTAISDYQSRHRRAGQSAPDAETQSRQSRAADSGSAPMSRGKQVTTVSKREATQNAATSAGQAAANLQTVEQWVEQGGTVPRAALHEVIRRAQALLGVTS